MGLFSPRSDLALPPTPVAPAIDFNAVVELRDVQALFSLILGRELEDDQHGIRLNRDGVSVATLMRGLLESDEFRTQYGHHAMGSKLRDDYRIPEHFAVVPDAIKRVLLIGSCQVEPWEGVFKALTQDQVAFETIVMNRTAHLPELDPQEAQSIDFQMIQFSLRSVLPEQFYFDRQFSDNAGYESILAQSIHLLHVYFEHYSAYNRQHGLTTFILNFCTPQQNLLGRLAPRYHLSNPVYFVERLNQALYDIVQESNNTYFIDLEQIVATFGKRHFQDDLLSHVNHGSVIGFHTEEADFNRLEPIGDFSALHGPNIRLYLQALYREVAGAYRSIRQTDQIKIVIFDLDDTLWRGVAADAADYTPESSEGWPLSMVEAASYLWRRGILIALVSKNDEATALAAWEERYGKVFSIDHFVVRRINWQPKAINIAEVLKSVNLLPQNALFVDDNPVERAAVAKGVPGIRLLDAPLVEWRRLLLWAPELQPPTITAEAVARTTMIGAQIRRDETAATMDRHDFLASLGVKVVVHTIADSSDPRYNRAVELINKTNQFNTTGQRWSAQDFHGLFRDGGYIVAIEVEDRFTNYGLVVSAIVQGSCVRQVVMSCRVFGMDVEFAALSLLVAQMRGAGNGDIRGEIVASGKNRLALQIFNAGGFAEDGEGAWRLPGDQDVPMPSHIHY